MGTISQFPTSARAIQVVRVSGPTGSIHFAGVPVFERRASGEQLVAVCVNRVADARLRTQDVTCKFCVANKERYAPLDVTELMIAGAIA
jgi:hypothetical protein